MIRYELFRSYEHFIFHPLVVIYQVRGTEYKREGYVHGIRSPKTPLNIDVLDS